MSDRNINKRTVDELRHDKTHNVVQNIIDVFVVLDLVFSTIGGILKSKNPELADKFFMVGGVLLTVAVLLTLFKRIRK